MEKNYPTPPPCPSTVTVRRNPYRKARATPLTNPLPLSSHTSVSSNLPQISAFPINDILSEEIPQKPPPPAAAASAQPPSQDSVPENLKVYLRIRPLVSLKDTTKNAGDQNQKSRSKNVWPQNPSKKKSEKEKQNTKKKINESCITVSEDFHSIVLSPPLQLQETKRIKSEVYEGFSYVFSAQSTQAEVYEKMMNPLVEDFLRGKSGMLAALGPTGSGKTHTVFGSPREPGMVPRALQRIFKPDHGCSSHSSRQFYLSIFEICAEKGKAERICDLTSNGPDLCMQQSTIKGLQEFPVQDVVEAEQLIARSFLRRSTAMTNANSQSSRSQCIINIRRGTDRSDTDCDEESNSTVLSIVDLAGAEREKRTGNQGARLAESNFINNTSMVFGLCLRSLLEHQKNRKKALHKHFQNSLLTRYLRDYMEGRKRMTLLLNVKPGEDDYQDASYLLRQTSPYMKIKFNNIDVQANSLSNKRQSQTISRAEQSKRMKLVNPDTSMIEEKIIGDENPLPNEEDSTCNADFRNTRPLKLNPDDLKKRERTHQIMQNFAKALWSVLKQHNEKLKVAENEIQILREHLRNEKSRYNEMEKELNNLRSRCSCSKENSVVSTVVKEVENSESILHLEGHTTEKDSPAQKQQHTIYSQVLSPMTSSNLSGLDLIDDKQEPEPMVRNSAADVGSPSICVSNDDCQNCQIHEGLPGTGNDHEDSSESNCAVAEHLDPNPDVTVLIHEGFPGTENSHENSSRSNNAVVEHLDPSSDVTGLIHEGCPGTENSHDDSSRSNNTVAEHLDPNSDVMGLIHEGCPGTENSHDNSNSSSNAVAEHLDPNSDATGYAVSNSGNDGSASVQPGQQLLREINEDSLNQMASPKKVEHTQQQNLVNVPEFEIRPDTSSKSMKKEKPKRRLLPASSVLVREMNTMDADEVDKPMGNGGRRKLPGSERPRTQGSISLLRILKSNLPSLA